MQTFLKNYLPKIALAHCRSRKSAKGEALRLAVKCPRCRTINLVTKSGSHLEKTARP